eukprot:3030857-Pleurochrysis_carterae.AAC.1
MRCANSLWLISLLPASRKVSKCGTEMVLPPTTRVMPSRGVEIFQKLFSAGVAVNRRVMHKAAKRGGV